MADPKDGQNGDPDWRSQADAGDRPRTPGPSEQSDALPDIVAEAAGARLLDLADSLASSIQDSAIRARAYAKVAEASAAIDNRALTERMLQAAEADAAKVKEWASRATLCLQIAEVAVATKDSARVVRMFDAAESFASRAEDLHRSQVFPTPQIRTKLLQLIAEAAVKAKELDRATRLFNLTMKSAEYDESPVQPAIFASVARVSSQAGLLEVAQQAEANIPRSWYWERSDARAAVAQCLARAGRYFEARLYCESCERVDKLKTYTIIVCIYYEAIK